MKLLYIFLAHGRVGDLAELATTLVQSSADGHAVIHFDLGASQADYQELQRLVDSHERLHLVRQRVRCRWGRYELVEAVVNAIREVRAMGVSFDYAVLMSGDCYPARPIAHLEAYLEQHAGREFIECHDENWAVNGLRAERYRFYFPLHPRPNGDTVSFSGLVGLQRLLNVRRKVPSNLAMRFGSQWWTLTWGTCVAVQELLDARPELVKFFRLAYIPDEMVFPSLVRHLVGDARIAGFGLTHFQFTNRGRPVVYHDDHGSYPLSTSRFFIRKVSPEARTLRRNCLRMARGEAGDLAVPPVDTTSRMYEVKVRAQTYFPRPGHVFFGDQGAATPDGVLKTLKRPYVVLCGDRADVRAVLDLLPKDRFEVFGFLFRPRAVGLGPGVDTWHGLSRQSWRIRDLHPTLFLTRVRQRVAASRVCVFGWTPGDDKRLLPAVEDDESALVVAVPVRSGEGVWSVLAGLMPVQDWAGRVREDIVANVWHARLPSDLLDESQASQLRFSKEAWFQALVEALRVRLMEKAVDVQARQ